MKNTIKRILIVICILLGILLTWELVDKTILSNRDTIEYINSIEQENKNVIDVKIVEDNVGVEIFGDKEYFDAMQEDTIGVSCIVAGTSVQIIPNPDFLDTQVFHYTKDGNLIMYISISNTIGGQVKYYFSEDRIIEISNEIEEDIDINLLNEQDILPRAKVVYDRYLK